MNVLAAFPRRPLKIRFVRDWWMIILMFILGVGAVGFLATDALPAIVDDVTIGSTGGVVAREPRLVHDHCTVSRFIFHDCELDFSYRPIGDSKILNKRVSLHTLFQKAADGSVPLQIRYDPARPDHISTSWGLGRLTNRILTVLFFIIPVGLGFLLVSLWTLRSKIRLGKAMKAVGANPVPVAAQITKVSRGWHFRYPVPSGGTLETFTEFKKKVGPFWMDPAKKYALALTDATGKYATLVDAGLKNVSLTDAERQTILAAREADARQPVRGADVPVEVRLTPQEAAQGKTVAISIPGVQGARQVTIEVPPGVANGSAMRMQGMGLPGANGGQTGDAIVTVRIG